MNSSRQTVKQESSDDDESTKVPAVTTYPDYQENSPNDCEWAVSQKSKRPEKIGRGANEKFPVKLHFMLEHVEETGLVEIVRWQPHGRAFKIYDKNRFTKEVLPLYFCYQREFASFQRQLNIYGFLRLKRLGPDQSAYYHQLFIRGRPESCPLIPRNRVATNSHRCTFDPNTEPNFYHMAPVSRKYIGSTYTDSKTAHEPVQQPSATGLHGSDYATRTKCSNLGVAGSDASEPLFSNGDNSFSGQALMIGRSTREWLNVAPLPILGRFDTYVPSLSISNTASPDTTQRARDRAYFRKDTDSRFEDLINTIILHERNSMGYSSMDGFNKAPSSIRGRVDTHTPLLSRTSTIVDGTTQRGPDRADPRTDSTVEDLFSMLFPEEGDATDASFSPLVEISETSCADMGFLLEDVDLDSSPADGREELDDEGCT